MKDIPKRKALRLRDFDYSENGAYFITICVKDMKCKLSKVRNVGDDAHIVPEVILTDYGKTVEKYLKNIPDLDRYIIMPNHVHLILLKEKKSGTMWASSPTSVSNDIRSFKTLVTKEIGRSLWQRSFYDRIIRDDYDYMLHIQYIDENPKKWIMGKDEYYA